MQIVSQLSSFSTRSLHLILEPALLKTVRQPTLVIHSREDNSVPFSHAEWSLAHIPHSELCEAGITGHFFWIDPDFARISRQMVAFLQEK